MCGSLCAGDQPLLHHARSLPPPTKLDFLNPIPTQTHPQPLAYGAHPEENVVYVGCHDNETVFDQVTLKAPARLPAAARAAMCRLALALVTLAQGVPFIHAGDDLLRSKSLDRDSYDSGDWFNRLDWTGTDNNFGVGLPPASKNAHAWPLKRPLLAAAALYKPSPEVIRGAAAHFQALLRVRYSSPLFRLPTAAAVRRQLSFANTGPGQVPGLIVMQVVSAPAPDVGGSESSSGSKSSSSSGSGSESSSSGGGEGSGADGGGGGFDPHYSAVVVFFNSRPEEAVVPYPPGRAALRLHPALAALGAGGDEVLRACRADDAARRVTIAARTAAVFVEPRQAGTAAAGS